MDQLRPFYPPNSLLGTKYCQFQQRPLTGTKLDVYVLGTSRGRNTKSSVLISLRNTDFPVMWLGEILSLFPPIPFPQCHGLITDIGVGMVEVNCKNEQVCAVPLPLFFISAISFCMAKTSLSVSLLKNVSLHSVCRCYHVRSSNTVGWLTRTHVLFFCFTVWRKIH